eukprot:XP_011682208.1 PREDICTED: uncharacterized protein LOC105446723 [Strongylocentrotus purpuratus]
MDMTTQKPLHFGDFKYLTTEKFQNYIVLISALEDNLAEYQTIRDDLDKIFRLLWELNEFKEEDDLESKPSMPPPSAAAPDPVNFKNIGKKGDILSNLLELEQHNLISTRRGTLAGLIKDAARLVPPSNTAGQPSFHNSRRSPKDASKPVTKSKTDLGHLGSGTSLKMKLDGVEGVMKGTSRSRDRLVPGDAVDGKPTTSSESSRSTASKRGKSSPKTTSSPPENLGASSDDSEDEEEEIGKAAEDKH